MPKLLTMWVVMITITVLFFSGCDHDPKPVYYWGTASATLNGRPWLPAGWQVQPSAVYAENGGVDFDSCGLFVISLGIILVNERREIRESLGIRKVPPRVGRYLVTVPSSCAVDSTPGGSFFVLGSDGDVINDVYEVLPGSESWLEITAVGAEKIGVGKPEISGRFQISFLVKRNWRGNDYSDTLRFTNGTFHTKILPAF